MDKDEALQMCLEYIETNAHERKYVRHAIKQALEQPVQEPVLWLVNGVVQASDIPADYTGCLYTTPPAQPATVQVSPLEFVTMVMEKEHLVGKPLFWAEWPNKENT